MAGGMLMVMCESTPGLIARIEGCLASDWLRRVLFHPRRSGGGPRRPGGMSRTEYYFTSKLQHNMQGWIGSQGYEIEVVLH